MEYSVNIIMADPAGNRTAFITDSVPARLHAALGAAVVADEELDAEQAGFITMPGPGHPGHLQMSGGEFCGNASRSFGFLIGMERQMQAGEKVIITVSGAVEPLQVTLGEEGAEAGMPLPEKTGSIPIPGAGTFPFVEFPGITHLILEDRETDCGLADRIIDHLREYTDWQAIGVMFLQGENLRPYVWVRELETRVWERSCGSGTLAAEQAGFITMPGPGHPGHLQMSGGEFCGNASRSFGYLIGRERQMRTGEKVTITVSGAREPLQVTLGEEGAEARMPLPEKTGQIQIPGAGTFPYVEFAGITHLILEDRETDSGLADRIIDHLREYTDWSAIGVMFLRGEYLRPCVWVRELETRVWERSCGSGTLACAVWKGRQEQEGLFRLELTEPGGRLYASILCRKGRIVEAGIGGPVRLEKPVIRTYHLDSDA